MSLKNKIDIKKLEAERLSGFLQELLREDENKYCADCEAKQPRWASWNLGVFLCIRCAGLHRNLGVHISKVKSINLDIWTAEQVQSMRLMGNAKAKAVYESGLPQMFRRPQNDQTLEAFIRAKYEARRYILKNWSPPQVNGEDLPLKAGMEKTNESSTNKSMNNTKIAEIMNKVSKNQEPFLFDLLDIQEPCPSNNEFNNFETKIINTNSLDDIFGPIVSAPILKTNKNNIAEELSNISLVKTNSIDSISTDSDKRTECSTNVTNVTNFKDLDDINFNSVSLTQDTKKSNSDILALFANGIKQPVTSFNQQKFFQNSPF